VCKRECLWQTPKIVEYNGQITLLVCCEITRSPAHKTLFNTCLCGCYGILMPRHTMSSAGRCAFSVAAPWVWNLLTDYLRELVIVHNRRRLKAFSFANYIQRTECGVAPKKQATFQLSLNYIENPPKRSIFSQQFWAKRSIRLFSVDIKFCGWPNLWRRHLLCVKLLYG